MHLSTILSLPMILLTLTLAAPTHPQAFSLSALDSSSNNKHHQLLTRQPYPSIRHRTQRFIWIVQRSPRLAATAAIWTALSDAINDMRPHVDSGHPEAVLRTPYRSWSSNPSYPAARFGLTMTPYAPQMTYGDLLQELLNLAPLVGVPSPYHRAPLIIGTVYSPERRGPVGYFVVTVT